MSRQTTEKKPCAAFTLHRINCTVLLVGRLVYIIGYNNDKNKAVTWEQITALRFPLVAAYCVSVPRLLHCPSKSECYRETSSFMAQWLTGCHKIQYQPPSRYSYKTQCKPTWVQRDGNSACRRISSSAKAHIRPGRICLWMGHLTGMFSGIKACWYWHIPWHAEEYRLKI